MSDYIYHIGNDYDCINRMTEGTLRRRPMDIQFAVCKRYADNWY